MTRNENILADKIAQAIKNKEVKDN